MKTFHHTTNTRERLMPNRQHATARTERRKEARKTARAEAKARMRAALDANDRLVRW